jgi:RNA polymerase sigma-70 factor (ECF subfamily)
VERVLAGDQSAYAGLIERYQDRAVSVALAMCGDPETARDLAQDAFITAYTSLAKLTEPARFAPWLWGILRNTCRRHLSRGKPQAVSLDNGFVPEPAAPPEDSQAEMISMLQTVAEPHREVLAAKYLLDMDYDEIAQMLGITVNNVRVRCCRAREALRQALAAQGGV